MSDEAITAEASGPSGDQVGALQAEFQNLKQKIGEQGNVLGENRRLKQEIAKLKAQMDPTGSDEYAEEPAPIADGTVQQEIAELREDVQKSRAERAVERLGAQHPDYESVVNSSEFQDWVRAKPSRVAAWQQASPDTIDIAIDLIGDYKTEAGIDTESLNAARTVANPVNADTPTRPQHRYSALEIQRKMYADPEWYRTHAASIRQAYDEGLVGP